jgi:hypothetical protein
MGKNLNLIAAYVASALVAVPMAVTPSAADEQFAPTAVVQLPDGQILSAFDISFVSAENRTLAVAASRVVAAAGRSERSLSSTHKRTSSPRNSYQPGDSLATVLLLRPEIPTPDRMA